MLPSTQKDMVDSAMAAFKSKHATPPVLGTCCFVDPSVRETVYPFIVQLREDVCAAVCPDHHRVHICTSTCRRVTQMIPGDDSTYICDITLMPRPRPMAVPGRSALAGGGRESAIDRYRSIHCIADALVVCPDRCSNVLCQRWYAIVPEDHASGQVEYICMEHNVVHCCNDGNCVIVGGRCSISGIEGVNIECSGGDEPETAPDEPMDTVTASSSSGSSTTTAAAKHVQTSSRRMCTTSTARARIAVAATRIFRLRECQERIDRWCEFVFEFLSVIECITHARVELYACAVFQQCLDEGLVVRGVRCLPEKSLDSIPNVRSVIIEKTSTTTTDIMLRAASHLEKLDELYKKYFLC
jgi:hypothetical protein